MADDGDSIPTEEVQEYKGTARELHAEMLEDMTPILICGPHHYFLLRSSGYAPHSVTPRMVKEVRKIGTFEKDSHIWAFVDRQQWRCPCCGGKVDAATGRRASDRS